MSGEMRWTRAQVVRRAAGVGVGLLLFDRVSADLLDSDAAFGAPAVAAGDVRHFVSRPDLRPPKLTTVVALDRHGKQLGRSTTIRV
jgi:hypothetical protein